MSNENNNTISRFAGAGPGTFSTTLTTFATGLNTPEGLAFDARGDLFATNAFGNSGNSITEFASTGAGTFGPGMTFATGLSGPTFLAFGPSVSAPVPEASTTVSLDLLLALGMGGMVVAARRKRRA